MGNETDNQIIEAQPSLREAQGHLVVEPISGTHPIHTGYDLLPGDLLQHDGGGSYTKVFPGLAIMGFVLTAEQEAKLKPVSYQSRGLSYRILEDEV